MNHSAPGRVETQLHTCIFINN